DLSDRTFLGTPEPADGAVAATGEADALLRKPRSLIGTSQAVAARQPSVLGHVAPVKQQPAVHPAPIRRWDFRARSEIGASSSLPPIPAKVASPSRQRPLRLGDGN